MSKKNMSSSEQVTYCEKYMKDAKRDRTERSMSRVQYEPPTSPQQSTSGMYSSFACMCCFFTNLLAFHEFTSIIQCWTYFLHCTGWSPSGCNNRQSWAGCIWCHSRSMAQWHQADYTINAHIHQVRRAACWKKWQLEHMHIRPGINMAWTARGRLCILPMWSALGKSAVCCSYGNMQISFTTVKMWISELSDKRGISLSILNYVDVGLTEQSKHI